MHIPTVLSLEDIRSPVNAEYLVSADNDMARRVGDDATL